MAPAALEARFGLGLPFKLLLSLTDRCNCRCTHCGIWKRRHGDELTPQEIDSLLSNWKGLKWVDLTGGEPTMRPDILELADIVTAHSKGWSFLHFATNGLRPKVAFDFAQKLAQPVGPSVVVTVSIDGPRELHDSMRGVKGAFDLAIETAGSLQQIPGVEVYIGTTVTGSNIEHLEETQAAIGSAMSGFRVQDWHINLMTRSKHFFGNMDLKPLSKDQVTSAIATVLKLRPTTLKPFSIIERLFLQNLLLYTKTGKAPVPCEALRASIFVGPTGDVYPCHILGPNLGNLRDFGMDIAGLLGNSKGRLKQDCNDCWTPCEAYPTMFSHPLATVVSSLKSLR
jgi:MoaA/NifB/PqqE/SkfB family radical SAM enzyme